MDDVLRLEGVSLSRAGQPILREIDWVVGDGERWVVLGPNGAGKTTLLEVASLYRFPSSGEVTVLGALHGRIDVRRLRRHIGYASAALARLLSPDLTAMEVVATGRSGVLDPYWSTPTDEDRLLAAALLERLGCAMVADRPWETLSEGERQRVQIARALMASPDLLLLDEPGAGLDLGAREQLIRSLSELATDRRMRAIVLVTHHVEEIPPGFTHALLLRRGRVLAAGPIRSALAPKALSACYGLPLAVEFHDGRWAARGAGGPGAPGLVRDPDGRLKAYRPLAPERRVELLERFLIAYAGGDFFTAHEILEPAWMGSDDTAERALHQGLIKLAAAGVHATRGNVEGVRQSLEGSARRLDLVPEEADGALGEALQRLSLPAVRGWIAAALELLAAARDEATRAHVAQFIAAGPAPAGSRLPVPRLGGQSPT